MPVCSSYAEEFLSWNSLLLASMCVSLLVGVTWSCPIPVIPVNWNPSVLLYESLWCLDKLRSFIQYGRLYMSRMLAMLSSIAISEHPFQSSGAVEPNISLQTTDSVGQKHAWKQQEWKSHMNWIMTLQGPSSANCLCNKLLNWSMALVQCPSTYLRRVFSGNVLNKKFITHASTAFRYSERSSIEYFDGFRSKNCLMDLTWAYSRGSLGTQS